MENVFKWGIDREGLGVYRGQEEDSTSPPMATGPSSAAAAGTEGK